MSRPVQPHPFSGLSAQQIEFAFAQALSELSGRTVSVSLVDADHSPTYAEHGTSRFQITASFNPPNPEEGEDLDALADGADCAEHF